MPISAEKYEEELEEKLPESKEIDINPYNWDFLDNNEREIVLKNLGWTDQRSIDNVIPYQVEEIKGLSIEAQAREDLLLQINPELKAYKKLSIVQMRTKLKGKGIKPPQKATKGDMQELYLKANTIPPDIWKEYDIKLLSSLEKPKVTQKKITDLPKKEEPIEKLIETATRIDPTFWKEVHKDYQKETGKKALTKAGKETKDFKDWLEKGMIEEGETIQGLIEQGEKELMAKSIKQKKILRRGMEEQLESIKESLSLVKRKPLREFSEVMEMGKKKKNISYHRTLYKNITGKNALTKAGKESKAFKDWYKGFLENYYKYYAIFKEENPVINAFTKANNESKAFKDYLKGEIGTKTKAPKKAPKKKPVKKPDPKKEVPTISVKKPFSKSLIKRAMKKTLGNYTSIDDKGIKKKRQYYIAKGAIDLMIDLSVDYLKDLGKKIKHKINPKVITEEDVLSVLRLMPYSNFKPKSVALKTATKGNKELKGIPRNPLRENLLYARGLNAVYQSALPIVAEALLKYIQGLTKSCEELLPVMKKKTVSESLLKAISNVSFRTIAGIEISI